MYMLISFLVGHFQLGAYLKKKAVPGTRNNLRILWRVWRKRKFASWRTMKCLEKIQLPVLGGEYSFSRTFLDTDLSRATAEAN